MRAAQSARARGARGSTGGAAPLCHARYARHKGVRVDTDVARV